jgi:hypothetical protein
VGGPGAAEGLVASDDDACESAGCCVLQPTAATTTAAETSGAKTCLPVFTAERYRPVLKPFSNLDEPRTAQWRPPGNLGRYRGTYRTNSAPPISAVPAIANEATPMENSPITYYGMLYNAMDKVSVSDRTGA